MANAKHSSETVEHYTPEEILDPARETLEVIELDPASSEAANRFVKAKSIICPPRNGLREKWFGRVWLNPPGGLVDKEGRPVFRKSASKEGCTVTGECGLPPDHTHSGVTSSAFAWWRKLASEWLVGNVEAAIFLAFSIELLQTSQGDDGTQPLDFPICYPRERIRFLTDKPGAEDGSLIIGAQPTHASCIVYLPARWDMKGERFKRTFSKLGKVVTP